VEKWICLPLRKIFFVFFRPKCCQCIPECFLFLRCSIAAIFNRIFYGVIQRPAGFQLFRRALQLKIIECKALTKVKKLCCNLFAATLFDKQQRYIILVVKIRRRFRSVLI
jgi:hypothetical protein